MTPPSKGFAKRPPVPVQVQVPVQDLIRLLVIADLAPLKVNADDGVSARDREMIARVKRKAGIYAQLQHRG